MQTIWAKLHLMLADQIGDSLSSGIYTDDGKTIKMSKRETSLNIAVGSIYDSNLALFLKAGSEGYEKFMQQYPIYRGTRNVNFDNAGLSDSTLLTGRSRYLTKATDPTTNDARKYFRALINWSAMNLINKTAETLEQEQFIEAMSNQYSNYKPTVVSPKIYEDSISLSVLFDSDINHLFIMNGSMSIQYLIQPIKVQTGSSYSDVVIPESWVGEIVTLAAKVSESGRQQ